MPRRWVTLVFRAWQVEQAFRLDWTNISVARSRKTQRLEPSTWPAFWSGRALVLKLDRAASLCDRVGIGDRRKLQRIGIGTTQNLTQQCTNPLWDASPDRPMRSLIGLVVPRSVAAIPRSLSPFIQKATLEFDIAVFARSYEVEEQESVGPTKS